MGLNKFGVGQEKVVTVSLVGGGCTVSQSLSTAQIVESKDSRWPQSSKILLAD